MTTPRPGFTHKPPKRGVVGPFSGRQLVVAAGALVLTFIVLVAVTTPLGTTGITPGLADPRATAFILSSPPAEGLRVGSTAPELAVQLDDGSTYQLVDLDGRPIRLDALRGKVVWINFWASWCPPCQQETPILRELSERYRERGLEVIGISVQETSPDDLATYVDRYQLDYTIGFDGSGHVFRTYKGFALPTQFFIDRNGVIRQIVNGPVDEAGTGALIESLLGPIPSDPGPS